MDFCIVSLTVGLTLRAQDERNYYCVQIDLRCLQGDHGREDKPCIEFAVKNEKQRIDNLVMWTTQYPREGEWRHMKVEARGYDFVLYLGADADSLEEIAAWSDSHRAFRRGAIGFWQDVGSGESACFRNLQVTTLD